MQAFRCSANTWLLSVAAGIALLGGLAFSTSQAEADTCAPEGRGYVCFWSNNSLPPNTRDWFQADNTLRNWQFGGVWAGNNPNNTPAVHVCIGTKNTNGVHTHIACSLNGQADGYTGSNQRPGWIFSSQGSTVNRNISAQGYHYPDPQ